MDIPPIGATCDWPGWAPSYRVPLVTVPERECSYLPGRPAQTRAFWAERLHEEVYHNFLLAGFRRSGRVIYQPICRGCRACLPIRVLVGEFAASKSQRRCWKRNQDLIVSWGRPELNEEKLDLYQRYQRNWHGQKEVSDREELENFLYDSPVETLECCYRDRAGKLLAVGICDIGADWLSSVYFYFAPEESSRSLGTFGALQEIAAARNEGRRYYYLGYWIADCRSMNYKAAFGPNEILLPEGGWHKGAAKKPALCPVGQDGKRTR